MKKPEKLPDQIHVGTYLFMNLAVDLFATTVNSGGASFKFHPEGKERPRITVGLDDYAWWRVIAMLLHEANELYMTLKDQRYSPSHSCSMDHAGYLFVQTHNQFTEMCAEVGYFMSLCLTALAGWHEKQQAYEKWQKKTAKKKK